MTRLLGAATLLTVVLAACSAAGSGHAASTTAAGPGTGVLTGTFSEFAEGHGGVGPGVVRIYLTKHMVGQPFAQARAHSDGRYRIALRPGTYYATGGSSSFHVYNPPIGVCGVGPLTVREHATTHADIRCMAH